MSRYYCPFCSTRYQFHKISSNGVLVCGLCGDPLIKKSFIDYKRIVGTITCITILAPLLIMFIFVVENSTHESPPTNYESLSLLTIFN